MNNLFEDEYMKIVSNDIKDCLEVIGKKICDTPADFQRSMQIINDYVKNTQAKKIVFSLQGYNTVGNEEYLSKEFLPVLAILGVKYIAVITGDDEKTQSFFTELSNYTNLVKNEYEIDSEHFKTLEEGLHWIESID